MFVVDHKLIINFANKSSSEEYVLLSCIISVLN